MFEPGQQVDRYRLDRTIHRGHGTVVFAATEIATGRAVAFKVLADRYATDAAVRQRFIDEAKVAARLDAHPSIATVLAWGQVGDAGYLVTEFIDGVTLAELQRRADEPFTNEEALSLLAQLAGALDHAHRRGAVHRDVRPANVMVDMTATPRRVYLIDFGITKITGRERPGVTGVYIGTADYASPEQIVGAGRIDGRADVYSLACIAFDLLTGRPPYAEARNDAARIAAHLQAPVPKATSVRPSLPPDVDAVFAKALAKRPADRYGKGRDLVESLRTALAVASAAVPRPGPLPSVLPALVPPARRPRHRALAVVATALATALVAVAVAMVIGGGDDEATRDIEPAPTSDSPRSTSASTSTSTSTTTTTSTTSTTTTTSSATTTAAPTTAAPGAFGYAVGATVTAPTGPESAFALGVQSRGDPREVAVPGSPAYYYLQWLRLATPVPTSATVTAGATGLAVTADRPVELRDFQVVDGQVATFTECVGDACVPLDSVVSIPSPDCSPGLNCPHVRSRSGDVMAYQRASLPLRWPAQVLVYELVVDPGAGNHVVAVDEPNGAVHYDIETGHLVATFDDRPEPGTIHHLTITFDDGSTDTMSIYYG